MNTIDQNRISLTQALLSLDAISYKLSPYQRSHQEASNWIDRYRKATFNDLSDHTITNDHCEFADGALRDLIDRGEKIVAALKDGK